MRKIDKQSFQTNLPIKTPNTTAAAVSATVTATATLTTVTASASVSGAVTSKRNKGISLFSNSR
jgi:hypothetical protein